ncbi:MAG: carboxypeptidase M32 [Paracoccaceae bacterium]|nr:carboxypeptidase M32 [Paracoccaceae bacterium]
MTEFENLMAYNKDTVAIGKIAGRLGWDQATMMPKGALVDRIEEFSALEKIMHYRKSSNELNDLLDEIQIDKLDQLKQRQVHLIRRSFNRTRKIPQDLAIALARLTPKSHTVWEQARHDDDFAAFKPLLAQVIALRQKEGQALAKGTGLSSYDGLLNEYEPDGSTQEIQSMFDALRGPLVELRAAVLDKEEPKPLMGVFDIDQQMVLSQELALTFGYDLNRGRIDKAVHPFSSGNSSDVRITTRTVDKDPMNCFYSTIHEVGHACYEQNINSDYAFTAFGKGASLGIHESQSRIYENQLGRSRGFTAHLYRRMLEVFGDFGVKDEETFYKLVNKVSNGYIRTEADEMQYNLHVMLRFDIERSLMSGDLSIDDLEAAWNDRFMNDFGYAVDRPSNGVLQDVHWSEGIFGYFPTYSLGNVYSACLFQALEKDIPNLQDDLANGDLARATGWLKKSLQQHGSAYSADQLMTMACGEAPKVEPLISYITAKFSDIYNL